MNEHERRALWDAAREAAGKSAMVLCGPCEQAFIQLDKTPDGRCLDCAMAKMEAAAPILTAPYAALRQELDDAKSRAAPKSYPLDLVRLGGHVSRLTSQLFDARDENRVLAAKLATAEAALAELRARIRTEVSHAGTCALNEFGRGLHRPGTECTCNWTSLVEPEPRATTGGEG